MDDQELSQPPDIQAQSNPQLNDLLTRMLAQSGGQTGTPQINPLAALQAPAQAEDSTPDPARDLIQQHLGETPQDILMRRLHMSPEERAKRGKWGNAGVQASNILLSLITGGNQRQFANEDYDRMTRRLQVASGEVRNQDLNTRAQAALEQAGKYKDMADARLGEKNDILAKYNDIRKQNADTIAQKEKDDFAYKQGLVKIGVMSQQAKAGDMKAKQALAKEALDWRKTHPTGGDAAVLAQIMQSGDVDVDEFIQNLGKVKDVTAPLVTTKDTNTSYDANGIPTGTTTNITGVTRGQLRNGGVQVNSQPYTTNADGSFNGNKDMGKGVANQAQIKETAFRTAQNLLQDFGTGDINKYTGIFKGGDFLKMARTQFEQAHGGTSTGEAFDQMMSPQKVIENIRSMTNRMNKSEYDAFSKTMGNETQGGEALVRRALIYHLTQDDKLNRLHPGVAAGLQITDKDGQKINIEDTPEFLQEFRNAVDGAIAKAKASRGVVPIKAPTIQDVLSATKARLGARVDDLKKQIGATLTPGAADRLAKYQ